MKKLFLILLFFCSLLSFASAPAGGGIRVDIISEHLIHEASADKGIHISRRKRNGKRRSGEKFFIYDIFYSRGSLSGNWEKMEIRFTPEKDERVALWLRGISRGSMKNYPFLHFDDLKITGAQVKNPDFEILNKSGALASWGGGKKENVWRKDPKSGKICARVSYSKCICQNLQVKKGVPVTITFYVRQEKPIVIDRGRDGMTNIYTDNASGTQVHISSGRLTLVPTFENCSYYVNRKKNEWGKKCTLKVRYREKGTKAWRSVIDPVNMEREKAWRGSIMLLKEDTVYEFCAVVSGEAKDEIRGEFRTRSSKFKVAETIIIDGKNFNGVLKNIKSGKPDGYILYKSAPGVILKGRKNTDGGVIECDNVKYVIFEGFTIDANSSRHGFKLVDCEDVVIRNCEIFNFGRCDRVRDMQMQGRWTYKGRMTGWDGGIILHGGRRHLIERCYIHTPWSSSNSWFYSHPTGPEAIFIDKTKGGTVIRYNDLVGSDARRWNDTIESAGNGSIDGGFGRDSDIYGNLFAYANDDSIEIEGGEMNVRLYYNRFQGSYCGVSTGCCRLGPSYQYRNVFYRMGDENNRCGTHFKNGMGNQGDGAIFIINNTTWSPLVNGGFGNFHSKKPVYNPPLKAFTRNNILLSGGSYIGKDWGVWNCDLDNDLFYGAGKEKDDAMREFLKKRSRKAIFADPCYVDPEGGDLTLAKNSPARNSAAKVPGLETKHLGALQDDGLVIPYRPFDAKTDRKVINFNPGNRNKVFNFTLSTGNYSGNFKVRCNDRFFTVTPAAGKIGKNSKVTFSVRLNYDVLDKARLHNGMCLVRFDDGFSREVSVYADFSEDKKLLDAAEKKAIPVRELKCGKGVCTGKVTIPAKGCYFLFAKGKFNGWARCTLSVGKFKTRNTARFISRVPGVAVLRNGHLSGYYLFLDKGTFDVRFTTDMKGAVIDKFFFTTEPEYFLK